MEADDVASAQQLIELDLFDCYIINPQPMAFETEHLAAKGVAQAGNLQPDGTASNNPESLAEHFMASQFAVVAAAADGRVRKHDPPRQGDHQANGQLAYGMHSVTCRVMKDDTASLTHFLIHVIDTGKCHADQLELGTGFDHCP